MTTRPSERKRISIDPETATAVSDAVSYWLMASNENFGAGWNAGDDESETLQQQRKLARRFMHRLSRFEED